MTMVSKVQDQERFIEVPVERISYKDVEVTVEYDRYQVIVPLRTPQFRKFR